MRTRPKACAARCAGSAFGGEDGPVDRLRKAAWDLAQWRDFTGAVDAATRSIASGEIERARGAAARRRRAHAQSRVARTIRCLPAPIRFAGSATRSGCSRPSAMRATRLRRLGGGARRSRRATARWRTSKQGRGASYRDGVPRDRVVICARRAAGAPRSVPHGRRRRSRGAAAAGAARRARSLRGA